ncbi:hypothetical protein [Dactylosporangium sp. NPDC051484]|uniref:hypothetical protein n=1 Tax=Dactylosporangium sp. NPDC051484 TaxID=3154942 RepID=UPI00344E36A1
MIRREAVWSTIGAVLFVLLLGYVGVLERLSWWLVLLLAIALGALSTQVTDALWRRRQGPK